MKNGPLHSTFAVCPNFSATSWRDVLLSPIRIGIKSHLIAPLQFGPLMAGN